MELKLYNTLSREIEVFREITPGESKIYSCGPTVYDYAHIGNLRAFLCADLLQRVMRTVGGYKVKWVMNLTDIDDKTIKKINDDSAWRKEMGEKSGDLIKDLKAYTNFYSKEFTRDIGKLGIKEDDFYALPRATEHIEGMMELIRSIHKNGFAYISDGAVYFDVGKWRKADKYGKLKNIDFENFKKGVRIDADEYEREQVSDFVLWKKRKENEPHWELEIDGQKLEGRPGWHLECSTMEKELLELPFDIHTGGIDLQFPHHEDEIAQSKAGYGVEPTNYWFHNEFLQVEGEKMSKSAGNFFTLRDLLDKGLDPLDIRFAMLSSHYRSKYNFTFADVEAAKQSRKRVQNYIYDLLEMNMGVKIIDANKLKEKVYEHLSNDIHTPKALAELFTFMKENEAEKLSERNKEELLNFFKELNDIFAVWNFKQPATKPIPKEVINLAEKRVKAKKEKNFELADMLRIEITNRGFNIKDTKEGFEIERK